MSKKIEIAFCDEDLKREFDKLEKGQFQEKELFKFLLRAIDDLKENPSCGIKIPRNVWPKEYIQKYRINNLFKYNLPNAWRLIYTIRQDEIKIINLLLEWFSHKDYEKRFSY